MAIAPQDLREGFYDYHALSEGTSVPIWTKANQPADEELKDTIKPGDFSWSKVRYETLEQAISAVRADSKFKAFGYDLEVLIQGGQARKLERSSEDLRPEEKDLLDYWGKTGEVYRLNLGEGLEAYHLKGTDPKNEARKFDVLVTYDAKRSEDAQEDATDLPDYDGERRSRFQVRSYVAYVGDGGKGFYNLTEFIAGDHSVIIKTNEGGKRGRGFGCISAWGGDLETSANLRTLEGVYVFMHEVGHGDRMAMQTKDLLETFDSVRNMLNEIRTGDVLEKYDPFEIIRELEWEYDISMQAALKVLRADERYAVQFALNRLGLVDEGLGLTASERSEIVQTAFNFLFSYEWPNTPITLLYPGTRCTKRAEVVGKELELERHRKNIETLSREVSKLDLRTDEIHPEYMYTFLSPTATLRVDGNCIEIDYFTSSSRDEKDHVRHEFYSLFSAGVRTFSKHDDEVGRSFQSIIDLSFGREDVGENPEVEDIDAILLAEEQAIALIKEAVAKTVPFPNLKKTNT
jgi:hypothetical protein